jgi:hypothetical protein
MNLKLSKDSKLLKASVPTVTYPKIGSANVDYLPVIILSS